MELLRAMNWWRCGRVNARVSLLVAIFITTSFLLLRYPTFRSRLNQLLSTRGTDDQLSAMSTPRRRTCPADLADIEPNWLFITVKTTARYHRSRLNLLLSTWIAEALKLRGQSGRSIVRVSAFASEGPQQNLTSIWSILLCSIFPLLY